MRFLYVTTIGGTMILFGSIIKQLINDGHTVDIACNQIEDIPQIFDDYGCKKYRISCSRSPLDYGNIKAIDEIRKVVVRNKYDIVHCHTPIASACVRLACKNLRKYGIKVIYTAHGFHFYKGAPLKNWLFYFPIEKICSRWTDALITINKEDYITAKKRLTAKKVYYVPGVGIDLSRFEGNDDKEKIRNEFSISQDAILLVSVGELNHNKNHATVIRAISELNESNIYYIIAGCGILKDDLLELSKRLNVDSQIILAGFRSDVPALYNAADICVFPSIREGQGLAAIEGMASGLPLIVSDNRGTRGFVKNNKNAIVVRYNDVKGFSNAIAKLINNKNLRNNMGEYNKKLSTKFAVDKINEQMKEIYKSV